MSYVLTMAVILKMYELNFMSQQASDLPREGLIGIYSMAAIATLIIIFLKTAEPNNMKVYVSDDTHRFYCFMVCHN